MNTTPTFGGTERRGCLCATENHRENLQIWPFGFHTCEGFFYLQPKGTSQFRFEYLQEQTAYPEWGAMGDVKNGVCDFNGTSGTPVFKSLLPMRKIGNFALKRQLNFNGTPLAPTGIPTALGCRFWQLISDSTKRKTQVELESRSRGHSDGSDSKIGDTEFH